MRQIFVVDQAALLRPQPQSASLLLSLQLLAHQIQQLLRLVAVALIVLVTEAKRWLSMGSSMGSSMAGRELSL
jgi:hypothetical protein